MLFRSTPLQAGHRSLALSSATLDLYTTHNAFPVPSGPPRGVEAEALNASAVRVWWRAPAVDLQHGQIRGYQVHYVRMNYGEPSGQPLIRDILIDDSQVRDRLKGWNNRNYFYVNKVNKLMRLTDYFMNSWGEISYFNIDVKSANHKNP